MRCSVSVKRLMDTFDIDRGGAQEIKNLCALADEPHELAEAVEERHPATAGYVRAMHSDPYRSFGRRRTVVLHAIDRLVDGFGVEALGEPARWNAPPPFEYVNMGDTYAATLVYKTDSDNLYVSTMGDIVEAYDLR